MIWHIVKVLNRECAKKSRILILGSMPGVKSLEEQEYYAHPQNRFWKLAGLLCKCENMTDLKYEEKINTFLKSGFALWDVIKFCKREGSLDSNIFDEVPNDIPSLLEKYPNIKTICFNGNKAFCAFKKYYPDVLDTFCCRMLPSTSSANAWYTLEKLYSVWSAAVF